MKAKQGGKPPRGISRRDSESVARRARREKEEAARWEIYRSIPQKDWRAMSSRASKVLNEQAARYGIPFGGRTICLPDVVKALHDFLARHARKLTAPDDEDPTLAGVASPALEKQRRERARILQLQRLELEGVLVARGQVRDGLVRIAHLLRRAGEALGRRCGPEAVEILHDALDDAAREIDRLFSDTSPADVEHDVQSSLG